MVQQMLGLVVLAIISFPAGPSGTISLSVKEVPVNQAIKAVVEAAGGSASFVTAEMPEEPKVTLEFKKIAPEKALAMVAQAAGLQCEKSEDDPGTITISRSLWPATVKVGGGEAPIIAATAGDVSLAAAREALEKVRTGSALSGSAAFEKRPSFDGQNRLVDLEVKDAPLSEVAEKLSWKPPTAPSEVTAEGVGGEVPAVRILRTDMSPRYPALNIVAADPVKDIKITAKVYRWPVGKVLDMLLEQTGLVCTKQESGRRQVGVGPGLFRIEGPYAITLYLAAAA